MSRFDVPGVAAPQRLPSWFPASIETCHTKTSQWVFESLTSQGWGSNWSNMAGLVYPYSFFNRTVGLEQCVLSTVTVCGMCIFLLRFAWPGFWCRRFVVVVVIVVVIVVVVVVVVVAGGGQKSSVGKLFLWLLGIFLPQTSATGFPCTIGETLSNPFFLFFGGHIESTSDGRFSVICCIVIFLDLKKWIEVCLSTYDCIRLTIVRIDLAYFRRRCYTLGPSAHGVQNCRISAQCRKESFSTTLFGRPTTIIVPPTWQQRLRGHQQWEIGMSSRSPGTMACCEAQSYDQRKEEKQLKHDNIWQHMTTCSDWGSHETMKYDEMTIFWEILACQVNDITGKDLQACVPLWQDFEESGQLLPPCVTSPFVQ